MSLTLAEIAARLGAAVEGDTSLVIVGVAGVRDGGPGEIAFVSQERYAADAAASRVSALIVGMDWNKPLPCAVLRVDKPEAAFTQVAQWFARPAPTQEPGVHSSAVVSRTAVLGRDVRVGPHAIVEADAELADRVVVGAQCYVGHGVKIGADTRLYPQVSIREFCIIGERCILHNGTVVGSDGFGYDVDPQGARHKIQQIGIVVIGNDVEIGANVTIDRARFGKTRIGNGVKIDNLVHVAHNVIVEDGALLIAQVGVAGSSRIGARAILAGQVGIAGHVQIGAGARIGAQSGVGRDVPEGEDQFGSPAREKGEAFRLHALYGKLPELFQRVRALERHLPRPEEQE